jgi:DNA replication protein DnaC
MAKARRTDRGSTRRTSGAGRRSNTEEERQREELRRQLQAAAKSKFSDGQIDRVLRRATYRAVRSSDDYANTAPTPVREETPADKLERIGAALERIQASIQREDPEVVARRIERDLANERRELVRLGVGKRFLSMDLDRLNPALPGDYHALGATLKTMLAAPKLMAVVGPRRRGKTALACGLCRYFHQRGRTFLYATASEYLNKWAAKKGAEKLRYRHVFEHAHLVVLDEVQERKPLEFQEAEFIDLVDVRHRNCRATIIISNLEPDPLEHNLGESIFRRLNDRFEGGIHECKWPDVEELLYPEGTN